MSYHPPVPTERQKDILWKLADGYTFPMVAKSLGVSTWTVKSHMERLYDSIGVHTRTAAVAMALRNGWIE